MKRMGFLLLVMLLALTGCSSGKTTETAPAATEAPAEEDAAAAGSVAAEPAADGLLISLAGLTGEPQFFDWDSDGTAMQLIALKDSDGEAQLAYNTCQVCAGSPYAYFEVENGRLICQNCGNAFPYSSVGKVAGGCNPMPVSEYEETGDSIVISAETLASISPAFANWKALQ